RLDDAHKFPGLADAQLEADRLAARKTAQVGDELHKLDRCREGLVPRRRNAVAAHRNAPRRRDLRAHLFGGQDAALPRLGALADLQLDHPDLRIGRPFRKAGGVEAAVFGAASEIAAADFPDQVAAMLAMIGADRALSGIVREPA